MRFKQLLFVMSICLTFVGSLFGQAPDTVYVPAETPTGDYYINSIIDYIVADTNTAGEQLHEVYKLERGKAYLLDQAADLRNPVKIVADPPIANDPEKAPAKVFSNTTEAGETSTQNLFNVWADFTIKNVAISGMSINGSTRGWGYPGNAISVLDSFVTVTLDGVWLDYNGWSCIGAAVPHTSWHINNLHARNEQNPGDPWTTFLFFLEQATVLDTFIIKNSTYFQSNSFFLFPPAYTKYLEVDHCTIVNTLKWPFHSTQWLEAKITNNIFYNVSALSLTENEEEGQDPDHLEYGLVNVDTLVGNEQGGTPGPYTIPEADRMITVKNNCYFWDNGVQDYWADNDSVKASVWMNSRTQAMFDNDADWPNLVAESNWNQDPQFNDFTDGLAEASAKLAQVCKDFRTGSMYQWDWDSDMDTYPELYELIHEYPLPEKFRSYSGLMGTDGKPLGDLNHYPPDVTAVEANTNVTPAEFELGQNYPNPFNPSTTINYRLNQQGDVQLTVFNILGKKVKTLVNEHKIAGNYSMTWDATDETGNRVTSGLYIYKLKMGSNVHMKKMLLLK